MRPLENRRVALLESRKAGDLAEIVRRLGGTPVCAASLREVPRDDDIRPVLRRVVSGQYGVLVLLTAAAGDALLAEAERHGMKRPLVAALARMTLAVRGPKPLLALRRHGLAPQVVTRKPHTSSELLEALDAGGLAGTRVLLMHYGEPSAAMSAALRQRGALVDDLCLYDWALPTDLEPLRRLLTDTIDERIDAMLFTSQVQFRHLLLVADSMHLRARLTRALRERVIVGVVGPVCAGALRAAGIIPDVTPRSPNGASLVQALADYIAICAPPPRPGGEPL